MAYSPTIWTDRAVSTPNTYTKSGETSSEVTLVAKPGTVTQAGTAINASNMNKIETGLVSAAATADAALPKAGGTVTGAITYQGEVLPQMRKNATTGIIEYYNGTRWLAMAGSFVTYAQSNTVQYNSGATPFQTAVLGLNGKVVQLCYTWTPAYDGIVTVSADISGTNTNQVSFLACAVVLGRTTASGSASTVYPVQGLDYRAVAPPFNVYSPVGTSVNGLDFLSDGLMISIVIGGTNAAQGTYATRTGTLAVFAGQTVYFCLSAAGYSGASGQGFLKNLKIMYDQFVGG